MKCLNLHQIFCLTIIRHLSTIYTGFSKVLTTLPLFSITATTRDHSFPFDSLCFPFVSIECFQISLICIFLLWLPMYLQWQKIREHLLHFPNNNYLFILISALYNENEVVNNDTLTNVDSCWQIDKIWGEQISRNIDQNNLVVCFWCGLSIICYLYGHLKIKAIIIKPQLPHHKYNMVTIYQDVIT